MAFNLGAFAGGLAKGGIDTYSTLSDIESQKKRDELVGLQTQQMKSEMQGKEALRSAIADQGGANSFTPNFNGTGGMDTNDVAPTPVQMSASERRSAIEQRAIAGGADPEAAMRYTATRRTADLSDAFDTTMDKLHKESADRMSSIKATAESGGMKGLTEKFGPELKKVFGHDIQFKPVPGAAGEIVAMDGKKVVGRYSSLGDATQALEGLVGQEFETKFSKAMMQPGMFSSSKELSDYMMKKQELGYKGRELDIKEPYYKAEANKANAQASALGAADSERRKTSTPAYQKMLEEGNAITNKLNDPNLPAQERVALQRQSDMHQVKIANYLGKTLVPKERGNPNELAPVKDNPGMFVASNGIYYRQDGDSMTPIVTPALKAQLAKEAAAAKAETDSAGKRTKALTPASTGSHAAVDSWKPAQTAPGLPANARTELADINKRLQLAGISPETEASLLLRKQELLGTGSGNRLLNARGID
jgi:hypothetical protein